MMQVSRITAWSPTELTADLVGYLSTTVPAMHIKAVTYHDLCAGPEGDGWRASEFTSTFEGERS
ncbi:MAG: hypothetical protein R3A10_10180 [Caldilineaceae bacterium]